ncbi:helix-turn-helix domain-containing protein [Maribacter sp. 2307ULW6-5]|uniref:helix-turn-helix domain-containing protein n=1 Tax=Maribacter sp. 2307ULW6-5 TaxID=3386275 RepID=UPI0039BD2B3A
MAVVLFIWGCVQSLIVGIFIPIVKMARNNYILSLIFFVTSLNILIQYLLRYQDWKFKFPKLLVVPDFWDFLLPTLLFLYIKAVVEGNINATDKKFLFVPAIAGLFLVGGALINSSFSFGTYIGSLLHKIVLGTILLWKLFLFLKAWNMIQKQKDFIKKKAIVWWPKTLAYFLGVLTYITFVNLCYFLLIVPNFDLGTQVRGSLQKLVELNYILFTCSILFITIFFFLKYPKILSGLPIFRSKSTSKVPDGQVYVNKLNKLIQENKIHLDTELNEQKLADKMEVQSYILSTVLNDYLGKSFSSYINEKRIEEAKRLLTSETHKDLTIFAIAVDSGFRSESVFYVNFKKHTGLTPKQYKNKHSEVSEKV